MEPERSDDALRVHVSVDAVSIARTAWDRDRVPRGADGTARLEAALRARRISAPGTREVWIDADPSVSFDAIARVMDAVNGVWNRPGEPARVAIRVL